VNNKLKNIHIKNNCFTLVKSNNNIVEASFPKIITRTPSFNSLFITYNVIDNNTILVKKTTENITKESRYNSIPTYVLRTAIFQDIILNTRKRDISVELVIFADEKFHSISYGKLAQIDMSNEDKERESYIIKNFLDICNQNISALREDTQDGCNVLLNFLLKGGM
jgi:hypothetical protein